MKTWDNDKHEEALRKREIKKLDRYKRSLIQEQEQLDTKDTFNDNSPVLEYKLSYMDLIGKGK